MADIAILLTYLTHDLDLDLGTTVRQKLRKMLHPAHRRGCRQVPAAPVEKAKRVATKYDRLYLEQAFQLAGIRCSALCSRFDCQPAQTTTR